MKPDGESAVPFKQGFESRWDRKTFFHRSSTRQNCSMKTGPGMTKTLHPLHSKPESEPFDQSAKGGT